jgi:hypothetical protein
MARELTTSPARHTLDEVLDMFGFTRDDLRALPLESEADADIAAGRTKTSDSVDDFLAELDS